jgi:hypothetical protein
MIDIASGEVEDREATKFKGNMLPNLVARVERLVLRA